jgi:hypothetical protein
VIHHADAERGWQRTETSLAKRVRSLLIVPLILTGIWCGDAQASTSLVAEGRAQAAAPEAGNPPLQLAQEGDVEVYYDQYGRRVIVDAYTGEVLSVERPRRVYRSPEERRVIRRRELYRDPNGFAVPEDNIP